MKKGISLLCTLLLCVVTAGAGSGLDLNGKQKKEYAANHRITMIGEDDKNGYCSATAVGDHVLLTAQHCVVDEDSGKVNTIAVEVDTAPFPFPISKIVFDGHDHALLVLPSAHFKDTVSLETAMPKVGDRVYLFGHPRAEVPTFYREGNIVAMYPTDPSDTVANASLWIVDVRIAPGDSGSAIYNKDGKIVGCVTYGISLPPSSFGGFYSMNFSAEQMKDAGLAQ